MYTCKNDHDVAIFKSPVAIISFLLRFFLLLRINNSDGNHGIYSNTNTHTVSNKLREAINRIDLLKVHTVKIHHSLYIYVLFLYCIN